MLMMEPAMIRRLTEQELECAARFLADLLRFPSTAGAEKDAMEFLLKEFRPLVDRAESVPFPCNFRQDLEYSFPVEGIEYNDRYNVRLVWNETATGPTLLFNAHVDVVPPSKNHDRPFDPWREHDVIHARGACDDKGQIALLYLVLRILHQLPERPNLRVVVHLVAEEEVGGNGTLAMLRTGETADGAIVLEPSGNRILTSVRGAVWFRIVCRGQAGHVGSSAGMTSALGNAVEAMAILKQYHAELLEQSRDIPLFDEFPNPMPLNFGRLVAGTWPASVPDEACLEGVMGLLPNRTREQVMREMEAALRERGSAQLRDNFTIEFMYRHDSHVINPRHPFVEALRQACRACGESDAVGAMPASADSWYYNNMLGIPTVIYGAGHLRHAHTADEQIALEEICRGAQMLVQFLCTWQGD